MEGFYKIIVTFIHVLCVFGRSEIIYTTQNKHLANVMKLEENSNSILSVNGYLERLYGSFEDRYSYSTVYDILKYSEIAIKSLRRHTILLDVQHKLRNQMETFVKRIGYTKWEESLAITFLNSSIDETHRIYAARECSEVLERETGHRYIHPVGIDPFKVVCNMDVDKGKWTVIQQRQNGSVPFNKTWQEYKDGFGTLDGEFWLGNDKIHAITSLGRFELRVDLENWARSSWYAVYDDFKIGDEASKYRLTLGSYKGTAGNALQGHNGEVFSTMDQDNDRFRTVHCSTLYGGSGGWWYQNCGQCKLNGIYGEGIGNTGIVCCEAGKGNMKFTRMMIRPM